MNATGKKRIERIIVVRMLRDILEAGCSVSISDGIGRDRLLSSTVDRVLIMKHILQGQEQWVFIYKPGTTIPFGSVRLTYDKLGWDVISYHSDNVDSLVAGAEQMAAEIEIRGQSDGI